MGLEALKKAIVTRAGSSDKTNPGSVMITNLRHKLALERAIQNIERARNSIKDGLSPEFSAFDLREAIDCLDEITGKKINDEILDKIFSSFCIGK
jgi:tRNA modification GTPase